MFAFNDIVVQSVAIERGISFKEAQALFDAIEETPAAEVEHEPVTTSERPLIWGMDYKFDQVIAKFTMPAK